MLSFYGDCEKFDFVLAVAVSLSYYKDKSVTVVTDDTRNYKYFGGEVSGVQISLAPDPDGITLYDCHRVLLSEGKDCDTIFVTDFSRHSIDSVRSVNDKVSAKALILVEQDSPMSEEYVDTYLGNDMPRFLIPDDYARRSNIVFSGKLNFRDFGPQFTKTLGKFLVKHCGVQQKDLPNLWKYIKRRG